MGACLGIIIEPLVSFAAGIATWAEMAVGTASEMFAWGSVSAMVVDERSSVALVLINLWEMFRYGPYTPFPYTPPLDAAVMARDDVDQYRNGTALGDARLKIFFENRDKDFPYELRIETFNVTSANASSGEVRFHWGNTTSGRGGILTDLWTSSDDGTLIYPPINQDTGKLYWYPNGSMSGVDAQSVPITGNWTTELTKEDVEFFDQMDAKKGAEARMTAAELRRRDGVAIGEMSEKDIMGDYRGDEALFGSLHRAFEAHIGLL